MATKKSPAELKKEGVELDVKIVAARRKPHNFAMLISKDGIVLEADIRKPPEVMWRQAKKAGGGSKGAMGTMSVNGKIIELSCLSDDAPGSLPRLAKVFFAERGLPYKVVLKLPEEASEADEDSAGKSPAIEARRKALVQAFKNLTGGLKAAISKSGGATAKKLESDALAFAKLIKSDDLDATETLFKKLKTDVATALTAEPEAPPPQRNSPAGDTPTKPQAETPGKAPPAQTGDPKADRRRALFAEFAAMQPDLIKAGSSSNPGAVKKVQMLTEMFANEMKAGNLDKAGKTLQLLKKTTQAVLKLPVADDQIQNAMNFMSGIGKILGEEATSLMGSASQAASDIGDTASSVGGFFSDLAKGASEMAHDAVGSLTDADEANKDKIDEFGLSEEQQMVLVHAARNDPAAITAALPVLEKIKTLKLPPAQFATLLEMSKSEPKAYAATVAAMASIDATGSLDVSTEAMTKSFKKIQATKQVYREKLNNWHEKAAAEKAANEAYNTAFDAMTAAMAAEQAAANALQAHQDSLPADLSTLSPAERTAAAAETTRLNNAHGATQTALTAANTAEGAAQAVLTTASAAFAQAKTEYYAALRDRNDAIAENETLEDKRELFDAISFGPLSGDAKVPLDEAAKAKVIEAYGKAPDVGQEALELIKKLEDPALIVANLGDVVDRLDGGFADADGNQLEIEKPDGTKGPPSKEAGEAMAISALKLGATRGQDYFDGFNAYMDSGAQLKKDPCGGTDKEPKDTNVGAVAQKRSAMMADAVIQRDGSVDFDDNRAKGAMDHILYHPGSLQTYSPHAIDEIENTKKLFTDATTKDKANEIIGDTKVAGRNENQRSRARHIVADTTGKKPTNISNNDAKEAVLSAMMTPLSQGPVGSCFSTGPVRRMKETEPLKVMEKFSDIVNTGTVKMADREVTAADGTVTTVPGDIYPANRSAHEGQNPLMRSLEYTIADAGANLAQSETKAWDTQVALGSTTPPGQNLSGIAGMLDDPTEWAGSLLPDPATGEIDIGIEQRIIKAIGVKFKYVYNAAPGSKGDSSGGGGDGRSTDGGYDVFVDGNKIKDRASYVKAMTDIALGALPGDASQVEIDKITAHITSDVFVDAVTKENDGDPPWSRGAGYGGDTSSVLRGGTPTDVEFLGEKKPRSFSTDDALERSKDVLENLMGKINTMTVDLEVVSTSGDDANHAFNAVPNHPSLDKIKGADTAAKIESELLAPGRVISDTKFPAPKAAKIFDNAIRAVSNGTVTEQHDLLAVALEKRPTEDMSPKELDAHIDTVLEDYKKAVAKEEAEAWKAKKIADGEVVSAAKFDGKERRLKKLQDMKVDSATAGVLAAEVDLPEVVVADANWGDAASQIYFVFAPDPATGKLRMWEKNEFDGTLTPADASWTNASWQLLEG